MIISLGELELLVLPRSIRWRDTAPAELADPAPLSGGGHRRGRGAAQRSGDPDGV
jgi:hypothetical protein